MAGRVSATRQAAVNGWMAPRARLHDAAATVETPPRPDDRRLVRPCLAASLLLVALVGLFEWRRMPGDGGPMYDEGAHFSEALPVRDALARRDAGELLRHLAAVENKGLLHNVVHGATLLTGAPPLAAMRAAGCVALLVALALLFPLGRIASGPSRDPRVGLLAVFLGASCPLLLQWGRTAMVEPLNLALNVLAFIALLRDHEARTRATAVWAALALLAAFFVKFNQGLLLLGAACGAGAWDALGAASGTAARARLRPLLPAALALAVIAAWAAFHGEGLTHYLTSVRGGGDPVRFDAAFYPRTLATRFAPWAGAGLLCALALVSGLRRALQPGRRVLLLHVVVGLALASFNASKLPRLIVPLSPGLIVTAALGAGVLLSRLPLRPGAPSALAAGALALLYVLPGRDQLSARIGGPAGLERVIDAGLELQGGGQALWVGSCVIDREPRVTAHHVALRALESGHALDGRRVAYLTAGTLPLLERSGLPLAEALAKYPQVLVVSDAVPRGQPAALSEPIAVRALAALRDSSLFVERGTRTVTLPPQRAGQPLDVVVTLWERRAP